MKGNWGRDDGLRAVPAAGAVVVRDVARADARGRSRRVRHRLVHGSPVGRGCAGARRARGVDHRDCDRGAHRTHSRRAHGVVRLVPASGVVGEDGGVARSHQRRATRSRSRLGFAARRVEGVRPRLGAGRRSQRAPGRDLGGAATRDTSSSSTARSAIRRHCSNRFRSTSAAAASASRCRSSRDSPTGGTVRRTRSIASKRCCPRSARRAFPCSILSRS